MARYEFKLPDIGEGVTEGEIVAWSEGIQVGATVKADQPLVEVMTDKATVTITSPKAGRVAELGGQVGQVIQVGKTLVVLETEEAAATPQAPQPEPQKAAEPSPAAAPAPPPAPEVKQPRAETVASAVGDIREDLPGMGSTKVPASGPPAGEKPLAAPATRKLARELGVDLTTVPSSGPNGRVTMDDVRAAAEGRKAAPPPQPAAAPQAAQPSREPNRIEAPPALGGALEQRTPLRGIRRRIFDAMARSKHTAAHFTFVEECDMTALSALRERMKPMAAERGVKLQYLPFIIKACVAALRKHPSLNSAYDESTDEIVVRKYYNIGIATATDAGLMVPVVKAADARSLLEVAAEVQRLADDAKNGKIKLDDLQGSTFTITSLGAQGGLFATPVLNFPEVGILGVHQIKEKPVVRNGEIVIGKVMLLSLSFDHRLIDGHVGAAYAYEVIRYLENPDLLMLEAI